MSLETKSYTYGELEKKYRDFFAPSFEITVNGKSFTSERIAVSNLRVTAYTGAKADNCQFQVDNAYNAVSRDFQWIGSLIDVGKSLTIKMGYTDKMSIVFEGIITGVSINYPASAAPSVSVTGMDKTMLMMRSVQSGFWFEKKVSDVVKQIGGKYGLQLEVKDTGTPLKEIEQFRKSDFHFLQELAKDNFCETFVAGNTLYFREPDASSSPVVTLMYGKNLFTYDVDVDISNQVSQFVVRGMDPETQTSYEGKSSSIDLIGTNGRAGMDIMNTLSKHLINYVYTNVSSREEAQKLADSMMRERALELVTARGSCIGLPELRAGRYVKLEGLGKKFDQPMLLSETTHKIDQDGYTTNFSVKGNAI